MFKLTTYKHLFLSLCILLPGIQPVAAGSPDNPVDYEVDDEIFDIPGHGKLTMQVPRLWNYSFTITDENTPPLITFYVLDKDNLEIFQFNLSVLWNRGFSENITQPEYIKSMVYEAGENTLRYSDQDKLTLQEIQGQNGAGYFFDLSDSSASEQEFQYLTEGALAVSQVLVVFSLFSNDGSGILREAVLRSLKSANHTDRKDI